jgi:hypothetical protein
MEGQGRTVAAHHGGDTGHDAPQEWMCVHLMNCPIVDIRGRRGPRMFLLTARQDAALQSPQKTTEKSSTRTSQSNA